MTDQLPLPVDVFTPVAVEGPRVVNLRWYRRRAGRGWVTELPQGVVRIDRPSRWSNPFRIGEVIPPGTPITRELAVHLFREYARDMLADNPAWLEPLRNRTLACWCAPLPCHGDVILELLEADAPQGGQDR